MGNNLKMDGEKQYRSSFYALVESVTRSLTQLREIKSITHQLCVDINSSEGQLERDNLQRLLIIDERLVNVESILSEKLPLDVPTKNLHKDNDFNSLRKNGRAVKVNPKGKASKAEVKRVSITRKDHICLHCSQSFTQKKYLTQHIECRHQGITNECHICNKQYSSQNNLKIHLATHDENREQFRCLLCDKVYLNKSQLAKHNQAEHLNLKHQCPLCKKTLKSKSNLTQHLKLHEGVSYDCDLCSRVFSQKSGLLYHRKSRHSSEAPFPCDVCGKSFVLKSKLTQHKKRCHDTKTIVGSGFKTRISSQNHIKLYSAAKKKVLANGRQKTFKVFKTKNTKMNDPPSVQVPVNVSDVTVIDPSTLTLNLDRNNYLPLSINGATNLILNEPQIYTDRKNFPAFEMTPHF